MNLEESDKFAEKQAKNEQRKKVVLMSIIACGVLIALLIVMIIYIQYQDTLQLKVYIDGTQISFSDNMFKEDDGTKYINIKELSDLLGYTYTKGEYKKYNENADSCYIKNNLEIVAMTAGKDTFTKYIDVVEGAPELTLEGPYGVEMSVSTQNGGSNTFVMDKPIKQINGELYLPFEHIIDVYNMTVDTNTKNRIRMYTLPMLFNSAKELAARLEYGTISGVYENIRAIPYGLIVVGDNGIFGVIDLKGQEILSVKYETLEFLQNTEEFFMRAENTVGLLDKDGSTIIKPMDYDNISILDEIEELYLVEKNRKYGVVNREGEVVIHVDYDRIGLKNIDDFKIADLRNNYLLFDKCIVAELDGELGLYDIKGKELLKTVYEGFGYLSDVSGEDSVLVVPKEVGINGLVINFDGRYAIYDVDKEAIAVPAIYTKIYSVTKAGVTTYYAEFNGEQQDLKDILKDLAQAEAEAAAKPTVVDIDEDSETSSADETTEPVADDSYIEDGESGSGEEIPEEE